MPPRHDLRYRGDREMFDALLKRARVSAAIEELKGQLKGNLRRELLGSALRLSRALAPDVVDLIDGCRGKLGVETAVEVYVYPSADFNAACTHTEGGRVFVLMSSSLVDGFAPDELAFVVGHELGHHLFDHHAIPTAALAKRDADLALDLFAWQRAAELSADRAGLACCSGLAAAGAAMFKLTSGLEGERVRIHVEELLTQAADLAAADPPPDDDALERDWLTTHPFSPLRVRALQLVAASELFTPGGRGLAAVDDEVHQLLHVMEPSWAREQSDAAEALRRLFFAAGILIAVASDGLHEGEVAALEKLLGADAVPAHPDLGALREVLTARIARARELAPSAKRAQVLRDLCTVAIADGRTDDAERAILVEIAGGLDVDPILVETSLAAGQRTLD